MYPRSSSAFIPKSDQEITLNDYPPRLVNQHNLKAQTKLVIYRPKTKLKSSRNEFNSEIINNKKTK